MIVLQPSEDHFHGLETPGSYEWSYFDGLSDDGEWGFVAIWFRGCPMSPYYTAAIDRHRSGGAAPDPADFAAFNFNLYHRGRRIFYTLQERPRQLFSASDHLPDVRLAGNVVRGGENRKTGGADYFLDFDTKLPFGRSRLVGDIVVTSRSLDSGASGVPYNPTSGGHFWVPAALGGDFTARLDLWRFGRGVRRVRFSGSAYHDRNFGTEPLHHLRADWHWGRLHSEGKVFVYFAVLPDDGGAPFTRMLLLENGRAERTIGDFALLEDPRRRHWSSLSYPAGISAAAADGRFRMRVDRNSTLDSGPFYHRFLSNIRVESEDAGIVEGIGITEFLRPSRLGVAPFRPFVKFRVRRG
ncbi:MAG: hypothetical protein ABI876_02040 [Bacteroidota bacterium]